MEGIYVCRIGTGTSLSFPEGLDTDNSISGLILFNNWLYNLYSFAWESVYLKINFLSKMECVEWKIISPYVWYIK